MLVELVCLSVVVCRVVVEVVSDLSEVATREGREGLVGGLPLLLVVIGVGSAELTVVGFERACRMAWRVEAGSCWRACCNSPFNSVESVEPVGKVGSVGFGVAWVLVVVSGVGAFESGF